MCTFRALASAVAEAEGQAICNLHFDNLCCMRPVATIHHICVCVCACVGVCGLVYIGICHCHSEFFNLSQRQRRQRPCHENGLCCLTRISHCWLCIDSRLQLYQVHQIFMPHTCVSITSNNPILLRTTD